MARTRLVDPMAVVDRVRLTGLGVTTQAEADAAAGTLERYRDTDDARRDAPVVAGSTADGTALVSLVAALKAKGIIVDGTETVEDEVVTGSVVADLVTATDVDATTVTVGKRFILTASSEAGPGGASYNVGSMEARKFDNTSTLYVQPSAAAVSLGTINDRSLQLRNGAQLALFASDGISPDPATFRVYGATGNTVVGGTLELGQRLSAKSAPTPTVTKQAAAGSTGSFYANGYVTDIAGSISITPNGTGITAGAQVRVTFANAKAGGTDYAVLVTPSAAAAGLQVYAARNVAYVDLGVNVAPTANVAFTIHYLIIDLA